jgi:hypothetical protein
MTNPIEKIRSGTYPILYSNDDFFYRSSISGELQRIKSKAYQSNSNQDIKNTVIMAEAAFNEGNYQAASFFVNNAEEILTPLAGYNFRAYTAGVTAMPEELKNIFFAVSFSEIEDYGRSRPVEDAGTNNRMEDNDKINVNVIA